MPKEYPYQDGDFTIIGPECFADERGETISWRGVNYYIEPEEHPPVEGWDDPTEAVCPAPGGCDSCPNPEYCKGLRVGIGITTVEEEENA